MALLYDPELVKISGGVFSDETGALVDRSTARGDWKPLREVNNALLLQGAEAAERFEDVQEKEVSIPVSGGEQIHAIWHYHTSAEPGSAVVFAHGGGRFFGSARADIGLNRKYVHLSGVPILSIDYRLAPEYPGETASQDMYESLLWLKEHAAEFHIDPERIALMGESSGGGVAAGAAILARDNKISVKRQLLIYPMLDDRTLTPDSEIVPRMTWDYDKNYTGWLTVLGDKIGSDDVSPVAAPGRNQNFRNLAPAYLDVGELDIFRDETIRYASSLWAAGVSAELHVVTGSPHAFDLFPTETAGRVIDERVRVMKML